MKAKKVILILLVGFLLYWMFSDPTGLANSGGTLFSNLWDLIIDFFDATLAFVRAL